MDAPSRDRDPRGHRGEQGESEVIEGVQDRANVVHGAGYDGTQPMGDGNARGGDTKPPGRDRCPGGRLGEQDESGDVEGDLERRSDGEGDEMDWEPGGKDGAMSGARHDSKQVDTTPLTAGEMGQHGRLKTRPTSISTRRRTYQVIRMRQDHIGWIRGVGNVVYGL